MTKAVFLDKDGTLIPDIPYNVDTSLITISDNAIDGLRQLQLEGYLLIVVSNQAGVARGLFAESAISNVKHELYRQLNENGVALHAFYYCPHHPGGENNSYAIECECRKPLPGMLLKAAEDYGISLADSWMIGDILNDVEAGNRAGCRSILIDNGNETEWLDGPLRKPVNVSANLNEAAEYIINCNHAAVDQL